MEPPPLLLGAAWYPEQWPESRWNADLDLMQKAHMHIVRVGEFAWTALEPQEGKYELDWLERAINLAGQHGIYVVLGTPSASPPYGWRQSTLTSSSPKPAESSSPAQPAITETGTATVISTSSGKRMSASCSDSAPNPYVIG